MAGSASQRCQLHANKTFTSNGNVHFLPFSWCVCIIWKVGLSPSKASSVVALTVEIVSSVKGPNANLIFIYLNSQFRDFVCKVIEFQAFSIIRIVEKKINKKEK